MNIALSLSKKTTNLKSMFLQKKNLKINNVKTNVVINTCYCCKLQCIVGLYVFNCTIIFY